MLASEIGGERVSGMIVETEAYLGRGDPASHARDGRRTVMHAGIWAPPGHWYVYRSYGIHWCLNLTCGPADEGAAVLLRAVTPLAGIEVMRRRRGVGIPLKRLTDGPGKLCQALAIDGTHDGVLNSPGSPIRLEGRHPDSKTGRTEVTPRIGITRAADWPLRFLLLPTAQ